MEPVLDAEQAQIREAAVRLCKDFGGPSALRSTGLGGNTKAWQAIVDAGWPALLVPEARGGLGKGLVELALFMESCGEHLLRVPLLGTVVAAHALARSDSASATSADEWLQQGRIMMPAWLDEEDARSASARWPSAHESAGGMVITGKAFTLEDGIVTGSAGPDGISGNTATATATANSGIPGNEGAATLMLTTARTQSRDAVLVAVDTSHDAPGVTRHARPCIDGSRADVLALDNTPIEAGAVLARGDDALAMTVDIGALLKVGTSAELIGVAQAALSMAIDHLRTRQQFGKPLASFQALQHRCVDCFLDIELNRSLLYRVASAWDQGHAHPAMIAGLKARATRSTLVTTRAALQLHGAMGYTAEHDIGLYYKRAVVLAERFGGENRHLALFSELTSDPASGPDPDPDADFRAASPAAAT